MEGSKKFMLGLFWTTVEYSVDGQGKVRELRGTNGTGRGYVTP